MSNPEAIDFTKVNSEDKKMLFKLGTLEITEKLGEGGMGTVYKAVKKELGGVPRAVKVLSGKYYQQEEIVERFKREAKILANLQHPNIVTIHNINIQNPPYYIEMEYIDGFNLKEIKSKVEKIPFLMILIIADEVCNALIEAHEGTGTSPNNRPIIHRDIKPSNIMIAKTGRIILTDFGIAKICAEDKNALLTSVGTSIGTYEYMSPEQREGGYCIDPRTDIYSLGIVMYEMLTGKRHYQEKVELPRDKKMNKLKMIIDKAIKEDPKDRYQSVSEMHEDIKDLLFKSRIKDKTEEVLKFLSQRGMIEPRKKTGILESEWKRKKIHKGIMVIAFVVVILVLFVFYFYFFPHKSSIIINSDIPGIEVTIDGKKLPPTSQEYIKLDGISKGKHIIEVRLTTKKVDSVKVEIEIDEPQELVEVEFLPKIINKQ
ncbi:MAG: serine/threonine-protein kinase [bacterium]